MKNLLKNSSFVTYYNVSIHPIDGSVRARMTYSWRYNNPDHRNNIIVPINRKEFLDRTPPSLEVITHDDPCYKAFGV